MNSKIESKPLLKAFGLMHKKKLKEAETILAYGLKEAEVLHDELLMGLYNSAYGVLYKLKKEFRKAWKYYEQAERLIPDDPALKIISARLLVDYFGQYDTVIRKMDKLMAMANGDFVLLHQAHTIQGLAHLRSGNKKKAVASLEKAMGKNFEGLQTATNLDFKLVHEMIKKKVNLPLCRHYLESARKFAKKMRESAHEKLIARLLKALS